MGMMTAKRVKFGHIGFLHGGLDVTCELADGSVWEFAGTTAFDIGVHFDANAADRTIAAELRWPDSGGATLAGECAWSAVSVGGGAGFSGFIMWDFHGTNATVHGLNFGVGVGATPIGWGQWKRMQTF